MIRQDQNDGFQVLLDGGHELLMLLIRDDLELGVRLLDVVLLDADPLQPR
jgi:hypothetical protein